MAISGKKAGLYPIILTGIIDGVFLFVIFQTRYIMRRYFDLQMQGAPLPNLSDLVFKKLIPEYELNLFLLAACYSLILVTIGFGVVGDGHSIKNRRERLIDFLCMSRMTTLFLAFIYLIACISPLISLINYLDGPHIDDAREIITLLILGTFTLFLICTAIIQWKRIKRQDVEEQGNKDLGCDDENHEVSE